MLQLVLLMIPLRLSSSTALASLQGWGCPIAASMPQSNGSSHSSLSSVPGLGAHRLQRGLWLLLLRPVGTKQLLNKCWALELPSEKESVGWEQSSGFGKQRMVRDWGAQHSAWVLFPLCAAAMKRKAPGSRLEVQTVWMLRLQNPKSGACKFHPTLRCWWGGDFWLSCVPDAC